MDFSHYIMNKFILKSTCDHKIYTYMFIIVDILLSCDMSGYKFEHVNESLCYSSLIRLKWELCQFTYAFVSFNYLLQLFISLQKKLDIMSGFSVQKKIVMRNKVM